MQTQTIPTNKALVPPLKELVWKGAKIKVYVNERPNSHTTAYTAGVATGEFTKDGRPVVEPISPNVYSRYDFYLADTKISFLRMPSEKNVVSRCLNKGGGGMVEVNTGKAKGK